MIKPTIGRVVLFQPSLYDLQMPRLDQPYPGFVCYVHSDRLINVAGFDANGNPFKATSVQLLQDDDKPNAASAYAEWMPYQKGQAAKTEQLEVLLEKDSK